MATRPVNIDADFSSLQKRARELRHLRLSAPLSQLTSSMPSIPTSVRILVLVVDNSVSWNTQLPPAETVAWERLEGLLLGIKQAKRRFGSQLERVQFLQNALAERIRSELVTHADVRQELINIRIAVVDEKNKSLLVLA